MKLKLENVSSFPLPQFRQFGIQCYHRVAYLTNDKRLGKALKKLERSLGPPPNECMRREALNAAKSVHQEISSRSPQTSIEAAVACTLVCACDDGPNSNLLGNFELVLSKAEFLELSEVREIENDILKKVGSLQARNR